MVGLIESIAFCWLNNLSRDVWRENIAFNVEWRSADVWWTFFFANNKSVVLEFSIKKLRLHLERWRRMNLSEPSQQLKKFASLNIVKDSIVRFTRDSETLFLSKMGLEVGRKSERLKPQRTLFRNHCIWLIEKKIFRNFSKWFWRKKNAENWWKQRNGNFTAQSIFSLIALKGLQLKILIDCLIKIEFCKWKLLLWFQ